MPKFSKLTDEQVESLTKKSTTKGSRKIIQSQYIEQLSSFIIGDFVGVTLEDGESKQVVRNRLLAAAQAIGYELKFYRTKDDLRFEIRSAIK